MISGFKKSPLLTRSVSNNLENDELSWIRALTGRECVLVIESLVKGRVQAEEASHY